MEFFATCEFGLEGVLGQELRDLGLSGVRPLTGGVAFTGGLEDARTALEWSLSVKRILLVMGRIDAENEDALFEGTEAIAWEERIPEGATMAVNARGTSETLHNTRFAMLRVKDAICDRLRELRGVRPDIDTADPDVRVQVRFHARKATFYIVITAEYLDLEGIGPAEDDASHSARYCYVRVRDEEVRVFDAAAQQFADRLGKMRKQRRKWAGKNDISAYRVYDADLPDYNMAIDLYEGAARDAGRTCVHVAEYAAPKKIDPLRSARRMIDARNIIEAVFEVGPQDVFVKQRMRAKGGSQYARTAQHTTSAGKLTTQENGHLFSVDLASYLDTGLFLDNRDVRELIGKLTVGKSFLNLFAYTCSASVYAAASGAKFTTSVDMSNTYLEWGERNMKLNGLMDEHQELVRADCVEWVQETRHTKYRWDIAFVDPPTFSNSSKMGKRAWDVQRDHAELLIGVSRLLTRGGAIVFTCNLRDFELDAQKLLKAGVEAVDITAKTIPEDFERNAKIHHCYLLRRISS